MGVVLRVWESKPVKLARAAFEIYGASKSLGAVGGSAVIGAFAPSLVALGLDLSPFQKWVIGVGTFVFALACILAILTPAVQRRVSISVRLKSVSEENERLRKLAERLQAKVNRCDGDRIMFRNMLQDLQQEGVNLRESKPSRESVQEWGESSL
jgi:hypothetical protein